MPNCDLHRYTPVAQRWVILGFPCKIIHYGISRQRLARWIHLRSEMGRFCCCSIRSTRKIIYYIGHRIFGSPMDDSIEDMDMANIHARWEDNAPGKYYVDQNCIICNICMELAPRNFAESAAGDHHVVCKQPDSMEEEEQIREAMEQCPVDAVGDDGLAA